MSQKNTTKKTLRGNVVSDAMDKTVVVEVERFVQHPVYKKFYTKSKKIHAHDENNHYKIGDIVEIAETKPLSKKKRFTVVYSQQDNK
jgi:small subunit ribosomal protein S17